MRHTTLVLLLLLASSSAQASGWGSKLGEAMGDISIIDGWSWLRTLNGVTRIEPETIRAARLEYIAQTESGARIPVRAQPNTQAAMISPLDSGTVVRVLAKDPFSRWYEVELAGGRVGYIEKSFLVPAAQ